MCDAYEAMTANRSYRAAVSHELACQELRRSGGTQFDPKVVEAFLTEIETAGEEGELDAAQHAAAHVRMLLGRRRGRPELSLTRRLDDRCPARAPAPAPAGPRRRRPVHRARCGG